MQTPGKHEYILNKSLRYFFKTDSKYPMEIYNNIINGGKKMYITCETEEELKKIIRKAEKKLI